MATIVLEYDPKSDFARSLLEVLQKSGEFSIHASAEVEQEKYDPAFVKKILATEKQSSKRLKIEDIWK